MSNALHILNEQQQVSCKICNKLGHVPSTCPFLFTPSSDIPSHDTSVGFNPNNSAQLETDFVCIDIWDPEEEYGSGDAYLDLMLLIDFILMLILEIIGLLAIETNNSFMILCIVTLFVSSLASMILIYSRDYMYEQASTTIVLKTIGFLSLIVAVFSLLMMLCLSPDSYWIVFLLICVIVVIDAVSNFTFDKHVWVWIDYSRLTVDHRVYYITLLEPLHFVLTLVLPYNLSWIPLLMPLTYPVMMVAFLVATRGNSAAIESSTAST